MMWKKVLVVFGILILGSVLSIQGLKLSVKLRIENLQLPENSEIIYPTKVHISDVYWVHIKGEKVIKCDLGYQGTKEYIEQNNSTDELENIDIYEYGGMSDIAVYDSYFDDDFWEAEDRDCYVKISYFKKLLE